MPGINFLLPSGRRLLTGAGAWTTVVRRCCSCVHMSRREIAPGLSDCMAVSDRNPLSHELAPVCDITLTQ